MQMFHDVKDGQKCRIIFTENGLSTIQCCNGDIRHQIPPSRLRTETEHAEFLLIHPKDKPYLHEVLEVVAANRKRKAHLEGEGDPEWLAALRSRGSIRAQVIVKDQDKFAEQYATATGESDRSVLRHPGVCVYGGNKWANTLYILYNGELPAGCPVEVLRDPDGNSRINNTRFVWELIVCEGFRLDP